MSVRLQEHRAESLSPPERAKSGQPRPPCFLNLCLLQGSRLHLRSSKKHTYFHLHIYLTALGLSYNMRTLVHCTVQDPVPQPGLEPRFPALGAGVLSAGPPEKPLHWCSWFKLTPSLLEPLSYLCCSLSYLYFQMFLSSAFFKKDKFYSDTFLIL